MKINKPNITLIGMAGAGKSTIGQILAKEQGYIFIDTDDMMIKKEGLELYEITEKFGERGFKDMEEKYILNLGDIKDSVISPGGSVIYSDKSMKFLRQKSVIIFIDTPYIEIKRRLGKRKNLSVIGLKKDGLKKLYSDRLKKYRYYADFTIDVGDRSPESIVKKVLGLIEEKR
jgi:shikimate kinase